MRTTPRLGEMLVEEGLIGEGDLGKVLEDHKRSGLRLGQYLTQKGIVREQQIADCISRQLRIEKYSPARFPFDPQLRHVVPMELVQRGKLVPLQKKNGILTVAMLDPLDITAQDALEVQTNYEVEPVICTEQEYYQLVSTIYGMDQQLDQVMESMEEMTFSPDKEELQKEIQVSSLQDMAEEAPVVRLVNSIFSQAVREGASDIHISPEQNYVQLRFRVDGRLREVPSPPKHFFLPIVSRLKILGNMDIATSRIPQDGRFTFHVDNREIHVRASSIPTIYGENMVLRLLEMTNEGLSMDELGMSAGDRRLVEAVIKKPYGMILATGPTGSGKSTSLYAVLRKLNQPDVNIITLEDPVEYRVRKIRQVQLNHRAGMTFASGLRSILRQDPDVVMVGEIRDTETAKIAVQAAMTGHKLLSTVHTNDAASAVTRLLDMGIEPYLVSSVLLVSIAQRLVRKICPYCKEPYSPPRRALASIGIEETEGITFMRGRGCPQCANTGYLGRTGIFEILLIDQLIEELILKQASSQEITRKAVEFSGLRTLAEDAAAKVIEGSTTVEEAASAILI